MSADDRQEFAWVQRLLRNVTPRTVAEYRTSFSRAREGEEDPEKLRILELLANVCSFHLRAENAREPFAPEWIIKDRRTLIPTDLGQEQLDQLARVSEAVDDPELRARLCDTLWVAKRDHNAARNAVQLYIESAVRLASAGEVEAGERFERALRLAKLLGAGGRDREAEAKAELLSVVRDPGLATSLWADLMKLIREFRVGGAEEVSLLAGQFASHAEQAGDLFRAVDLLDVKASADASREAHEDHRQTLAQLAEVYVQISERMTPAMAGAEWLEKAILVHQQAGNKERVADLQKSLIKLQAQVVDEMGVLSSDIDLSQVVDESREHVRGKPWPQVLYYFAATLSSLLDPKELRERVQSQLREHPVLGLISRVKVDASGRPVDRQPAALGASEEDSAAGHFALMCQEADIVRQLVVQGQILPAKDQILSEHSFSYRDLIPLLRYSPFVPPGRELSFSRGLCAGFDGDWLTALYVLLPQLENSCRSYLELQGISVRTVDPEGSQEYFSLGRTLKRIEVQELLGPRLTFELRSLLTESAGENLRNEALHGLLSDAFCMGSPTIPYFWWLALRLCMAPIFTLTEEPSTQEVKEGSSEG